MQYDDKIMYEVFKIFLTKKPEYLKNDTSLKDYIDRYVNALPQFAPDLVRWHVAILFDEFLIKQSILEAIFRNWRLEENTNQFNRSGQELYETLKKKYP